LAAAGGFPLSGLSVIFLSRFRFLNPPCGDTAKNAIKRDREKISRIEEGDFFAMSQKTKPKGMTQAAAAASYYGRRWEATTFCCCCGTFHT
jgi:hypothetical protein